MRLVLHHIPVCPFSQRVEILLALKGIDDAVVFDVVDITKPRDPALLEMGRGSTALPILEVGDRTPLRESRVILRFIEETFAAPPVRRTDPHEHGLENLIASREGSFGEAGYAWVLNQDEGEREMYRDRFLSECRALNDMLLAYAPGETFVFDRFGWAETVFTSLFQRFWFLEYYEDFALPEGAEFDRLRRWWAACLDEPCAQQVSREEIVKLYYDYARGAGNGALPPGREVSSFTFEPDWPDRPMPPADKYRAAASDADLGLV